MKKSDATFIGFLIRSKKWIKLSLTESKSRQKTYLSQRRRDIRVFLDRINRIYGITEGSLKVPRRATKCLVQAELVHPFLAPHGLTAHQRCQVRSANHLSEHTEKARSHRAQRNRTQIFTDDHRLVFFSSIQQIRVYPVK